MDKKWFGLLEALLFPLLILVLLFAPVFSYVPSGAEASSFTPLCEVIAGAPDKAISIASYVFLPLFLFWSLAKIIVSFRLHDEKEEKASFYLYFVWAGLGLGYLIFLAQDQSYVAFLIALLFTAGSVGAFYLDYHFYGQK